MALAHYKLTVFIQRDANGRYAANCPALQSCYPTRKKFLERYAPVVSILGPLAGEPPEPMTREQFEAARKRIRTSWNGSVTFTKADAERLIAEIAWLKRH